LSAVQERQRVLLSHVVPKRLSRAESSSPSLCCYSTIDSLVTSSESIVEDLRRISSSEPTLCFSPSAIFAWRSYNAHLLTSKSPSVQDILLRPLMRPNRPAKSRLCTHFLPRPPESPTCSEFFLPMSHQSVHCLHFLQPINELSFTTPGTHSPVSFSSDSEKKGVLRWRW
jgi:hypothetical protein